MESLAVCAPGLEPYCAAELADLGIRCGATFRGGVPFRATARQLYSANQWLRTATRVVVRVSRFDSHNFEDMVDQLRTIEWDTWLDRSRPAQLRVSSKGSRLYHTGAIAQRLAAVLPCTVVDGGDDGDGDGGRGADGDDGGNAADNALPPQLIIVRVSHNRFTVSVDSSGHALHRRGWRQALAKAPLRESLAAALVMSSGWDRSSPLIDPFCGSGTIAIEAALLASGRPPRVGRDYSFMRWPSFAPGTWASVTAPQSGADTALELSIVGSDRDAGAVEASRQNAQRAGVGEMVSFSIASVSELGSAGAEGRGAVVTNPPYGVRVRGGDLRNLYARFGKQATAQLPGWSVAMLVADERLARHTGLALSERFVTRAGAIEVKALGATVAPATP
jgi:putative N6-adenine-specific DNA methylase